MKSETTRTIALPKGYDPWAEEIFQYFQKTPKKEYVFPYKRQPLYEAIEELKIFSTLRYHGRHFGNDHLRFARQEELRSIYGFENPELDAYGVIKENITRGADPRKSSTTNSDDRWKVYIMMLTKKYPYADKLIVPPKRDKEITSNWAWKKAGYILHYISDDPSKALCGMKLRFDRLQPYQLEPDESLKCRKCLHKIQLIANENRKLSDSNESRKLLDFK